MSPIDRAQYLLVTVCDFLRGEKNPDGTIHYDDADCDDQCLADDCEAAAADLGVFLEIKIDELAEFGPFALVFDRENESEMMDGHPFQVMARAKDKGTPVIGNGNSAIEAIQHAIEQKRAGK